MTSKPVPTDDTAPTDEDEHAGLARHLDTNFLIIALVPGTREDQRLRQWIRQGLVISMSSVGWAEFLCGPVSQEITNGRAKSSARRFLSSRWRRRKQPSCSMLAGGSEEHYPTV